MSKNLDKYKIGKALLHNTDNKNYCGYYFYFSVSTKS